MIQSSKASCKAKFAFYNTRLVSYKTTGNLIFCGLKFRQTLLCHIITVLSMPNREPHVPNTTFSNIPKRKRKPLQKVVKLNKKTNFNGIYI